MVLGKGKRGPKCICSFKKAVVTADNVWPSAFHVQAAQPCGSFPQLRVEPSLAPEACFGFFNFLWTHSVTVTLDSKTSLPLSHVRKVNRGFAKSTSSRVDIVAQASTLSWTQSLSAETLLSGHSSSCHTSFLPLKLLCHCLGLVSSSCSAHPCLPSGTCYSPFKATTFCRIWIGSLKSSRESSGYDRPLWARIYTGV